MSKYQDEIDFFRELGTDDVVACYALITSSHCAALLLSEEDHISLLLKSKTPRGACFDVITKTNSLFDNLCTFTNAQWYSSDTEKLPLACADLYVTCCHKI